MLASLLHIFHDISSFIPWGGDIVVKNRHCHFLIFRISYFLFLDIKYSKYSSSPINFCCCSLPTLCCIYNAELWREMYCCHRLAFPFSLGKLQINCFSIFRITESPHVSECSLVWQSNELNLNWICCENRDKSQQVLWSETQYGRISFRNFSVFIENFWKRIYLGRSRKYRTMKNQKNY